MFWDDALYKAKLRERTEQGSWIDMHGWKVAPHTSHRGGKDMGTRGRRSRFAALPRALLLMCRSVREWSRAHRPTRAS